MPALLPSFLGVSRTITARQRQLTYDFAETLHSDHSASRRTKPALNAFALTFEGRILPGDDQ
jgi:hypothetical protein